MPVGEYVAGLAFFGGTWGGAGYVAAVVVKRPLLRLDPAPRALAFALVFLGALLGAHLVPGVFGVLSPATVTVTAVVEGLLASRLATTVGAAQSPTPPPAAEGRRASVILAAAAVTFVLLGVLAVLWRLRNQPPIHSDAMSFGLPAVAEWVRSGSIWNVGAFLPLLQVRTYPNNGELLDLATILPWRNDAFLRLVFPPLVAMTGLGVYAIGRELRAPAASSALLAAAVVATSAVAVPALENLKPDVFMYATFAAGALFLIRHIRTEATGDLLLAGLGLGLSFGSRWYAISAVVVVAGVWLTGLFVAGRPRLLVLRACAVFGGVALGAGGFWLIRNLVLTGNPLYPVRIAPFGVTLFDAPPDVLTERFGFTIVDRFGQPGVLWHDVLPGWWAALGPPGLLVLLGTAGAIALAAGRGGRHAARPLALGVAVIGLAIVYVFLPAGSQGLASRPIPGIVEANTRWLVPALILGAGASAWAAGHLRRGGVVIEVLAFVAVIVSVPRVFKASAGDFVMAAAVLAGAGLAWILESGPIRSFGALTPRRRAAVAGAGTLASVVTIGIGGEVHQRHYNAQRFGPLTPVLSWVEKNAPSGNRVGVSGYWKSRSVPIYGLFGPRLGNQVEYVGPIQAGQVRGYVDPARFRRALQRGRYDLLVVGTAEEPDLKGLRPQRTLANPPPARWAKSLGFVEVARDPSFVLMARRATPGDRGRPPGD